MILFLFISAMSDEPEPCIQDDPENDNRDISKYVEGALTQLRDEDGYAAPCPADMKDVDEKEVEKLEKIRSEINKKKEFEGEEVPCQPPATPCNQPNPATPRKDTNEQTKLPQQNVPVIFRFYYTSFLSHDFGRS